MSPHVLSVLATPGGAVTGATATRALGGFEETLVEVTLPGRPRRPGIRLDGDAFPSPDETVNPGAETSDLLAQLLARMGALVEDVAPDVVVVHGGGPGALAAALATVTRSPSLLVAEGGLRTGAAAGAGRLCPDHAADVVLAPTTHAVATLRSEGRTAGIRQVGDLRAPAVARAAKNTSMAASVEERGLPPGEYVLLALRSPGGLAGTDEVRAVLRGATAGPLPVVVPTDPSLRSTLADVGVLEGVRNSCRVVEPAAYGPFLSLLANAAGVLTDDVGVQREASLLRTPCVTLATSTPWPGAVKDGWNALVGTDSEGVQSAVTRCASIGLARPGEPTGDGSDDRLREAVESVASGKTGGWAV